MGMEMETRTGWVAECGDGKGDRGMAMAMILEMGIAMG